MYKIKVKVNLQEGESAGELTKAFFQEFYVENDIKVLEKGIEIVIYFMDPPMTIMEALSKYKNFELEYTKDLQGDASVSKFTPKQEREEKEKQNIAIPEIEEIAKRASSFSHFVGLLAEWLEIGKNQVSIFKEFGMAAKEVSKITWKNLVNTLNAKNIEYKSSSQALIAKQVSKKLQKYSMTAIPLFNLIKEYSTYDFKGEEEAKLVLIPMNEDLKIALSEVDKSIPIEQRVFFVLKAMGVEKREDEERKQIVQFVTEVVKKKIVLEDSLLNEPSIPRMAFSEFLNEYVSKNGMQDKVKAVDFLKELQTELLREDEL